MNCGEQLTVDVPGWRTVTLSCSRDAGHSGDHHAGKPGAWRRTMADVIGVADPDNRQYET